MEKARNIGVVFASTGGNKIVRALRSFHRMEPELSVHIIFDTSSNTWKADKGHQMLTWFDQQPNVKTRCIENSEKKKQNEKENNR